jgi:hypothetical protein
VIKCGRFVIGAAFDGLLHDMTEKTINNPDFGSSDMFETVRQWDMKYVVLSIDEFERMSAYFL